MRRFDEALNSYQQALAIKRQTNDQHREESTLYNLGVTYTDLRRFAEAVACFEQTLAIKRETGDQHGEGQALEDLGNAYHAMRQHRQADECWREAAAAMRDVGDHDEAVHLEHLAAGTAARPRRRGLRRRPSS